MAIERDIRSLDKELLELRDRIEATVGIRRGLASMERGKGRPAEDVFAELRKKHNITAKP